MSDTMDAIVISRFGGPEVLEHRRVPKPTPVAGEVLIHVKAFGVNHAEMHMRRGEWDEWNAISGLECAGTVAACPCGSVAVGSTVVGVMGGMGRSRPGGYGEYASVPASNVVAITAGTLPWEQLAALPETYSTAYSCVLTVLDVRAGERVLIRGATSTLGQAALNLAVNAGATVTATTRQEARFAVLGQMGAADVKREQDDLGAQFAEPPRFDKTLNLIGNRALLESIRLTRPGGRMLQAGWLGGLEPVPDFNPMLQMESGVHFSLFHSKVLGSRDFPLSGIPLQETVDKLARGEWDARPAHVFDYSEIREAHKLLDSGKAGGKIVVTRG
ncbi:chaperonin 10-like protein [Lasiosphaeria miniovina]|uniref:Chaperonin 10-like protein n=1 Tax=Lasiosphaeria miniovina TaxID=1954250 RepID=A0AA40A6Y8_9PEZI|nr:chaperonin 10-like protein [Lasiosphaeria miniovina]KAK0710296.1 chaperonin 10-like protein [Lasiosphaeria miniovina]